MHSASFSTTFVPYLSKMGALFCQQTAIRILPIYDFLQHASKVKTTFCAGKQEGQEPSASAQSTACKLNQQVSSQRADFIASHTPTSLNKAHKVSHAVRSSKHAQHQRKELV
jgi:hypothetical protein